MVYTYPYSSNSYYRKGALLCTENHGKSDFINELHMAFRSEAWKLRGVRKKWDALYRQKTFSEGSRREYSLIFRAAFMAVFAQ